MYEATDDLAELLGVSLDINHIPGIRLMCIFNHGNAAAFSTHTHAFPYSEQGAKQAQVAMRVYDEAAYVIATNPDDALEDLVIRVAKKTGVAEGFIESLMAESVKGDAKYDERYASLSGYTLEVTDLEGRRSYAQWLNQGLIEAVQIKHLGYESVRCMEPWYGLGRRYEDLAQPETPRDTRG